MVFIYLFIYLLGANQKNIQLHMLKEMRDQGICEWIYVLHEYMTEQIFRKFSQVLRHSVEQ